MNSMTNMSIEQLLIEYKNLLQITKSLAETLSNIEILEKYPEEREKRFWSNHHCWLYKDDAVALVNLAQINFSLETFKSFTYNIDSNQELKMLLQGLSINTINEPQKINEASD